MAAKGNPGTARQGIVRFSLSVEKGILEAFDEYIRREGYPTRSEAFRAIVRRLIVEDTWRTRGGPVAAALLLIYDHHKRDVVRRLLNVQHDFHDVIVASQHVHLDHDNCMELVTLRGDAGRVETLLKRIRNLKGIKHSGVIASGSGESLP